MLVMFFQKGNIKYDNPCCLMEQISFGNDSRVEGLVKGA